MFAVYFTSQNSLLPPPPLPPLWCIGVPHIGVTVVRLSGTALPMVVAEVEGVGEGREPQSWGDEERRSTLLTALLEGSRKEKEL